MGEFLTVAVVLGILFIGLPWIILHYITRWKQSASLTGEDEKLLDELHYTARRLEDRLNTIERIVSADHPEWKLGSSAAPEALDYDITRRN
ncbi:MAG: envelope stress response membrane protein PspB [Sphingomonas sp. 28-66-16]|nr:MAG: envelope stress response membrane protein PspB [Sphingomonas sp. 28-66-16]